MMLIQVMASQTVIATADADYENTDIGGNGKADAVAADEDPREKEGLTGSQSSLRKSKKRSSTKGKKRKRKKSGGETKASSENVADGSTVEAAVPARHLVAPSAWFSAVSLGDVTLLKQYLETGVDVNIKDEVSLNITISHNHIRSRTCCSAKPKGSICLLVK